MLLHLPRSLNLTFDNMFRDDVSMDSFIKTITGQTDEPGLDAHNEIVLQPVLILKKTYSTKIGNTK
jgi:hypothetical protein